MITCERCGHHNVPEARYCSSCGKHLEHAPEENTGTLAPLEAFTEPGDEQIAKVIAELPKGIAFLVVRAGETAGSWFALEGSVTTLGRHPQSDIFLDDITVSRRHAEISKSPSGYVLTDIGSLNGTYLNRARVEEADVRHGDEVQIGKYRFFFANYGIES